MLFLGLCRHRFKKQRFLGRADQYRHAQHRSYCLQVRQAGYLRSLPGSVPFLHPLPPSYLDEQNEPKRLSLTPVLPERYRRLDTQALRDRRRTFTAELAPDTIQDEFAIASILFDMEDYLAGGPSPYPLEEALEDAYFTLLSRQAQDNPFAAVSSERMPWHT